MKTRNKIGLGAGIIILSFLSFLALEFSHTTNFIEYTPPEMTENVMPTGPIFAIQILNDSFQEGNPDYAPDVAVVSQGDRVFTLNTSELTLGEYEYLCVVHPWMVATLVIE